MLSSQSRQNIKTLVLASKEWLVEQHLTQDASRSPHIHRSVTAAREGFGQWIVQKTDGFVRVQPGCTGWTGGPWKVTMDHHLILWKKSFLVSRNSRIHKIYHYLTTWKVFSDRLQPLLLGPSPLLSSNSSIHWFLEIQLIKLLASQIVRLLGCIHVNRYTNIWT